MIPFVFLWKVVGRRIHPRGRQVFSHQEHRPNHLREQRLARRNLPSIRFAFYFLALVVVIALTRYSRGLVWTEQTPSWRAYYNKRQQNKSVPPYSSVRRGLRQPLEDEVPPPLLKEDVSQEYSNFEDIALLKEFLSLQWKNSLNLVHVVQTRFMQYQPHLLHLGRARMKLFRTISLPSMKNQTNQQFLWIIRTDPNLDPELKDEFLEISDEMENLVVILSNQNVEDFRNHGLDDITDYDKQILARNDHERWKRSCMLGSYYAGARDYRIVLESRLDADDALAIDVIDVLQHQAVLHLWQKPDGEDYRVWCLGRHMEWQFYNPWNENSTRGSLVGFPYGHCVTPGLTYGYQYGAKASDVPTHQHHKLRQFIPSCDVQSTRCLEVLRKKAQPLALRARTPTSAGMLNVFTSTEASKLKLMDQWSRLQGQAWNQIEPTFGVKESSLIRMRQEIEKDLPMIAAENAAGQCTPGHSCKPTTRAMLSRFQKQ